MTWIDDNKGQVPWTSNGSNDLIEDKGQGVWAFTAQKNKWGYLNNPRWMNPSGDAVNYDGREDEEPQVWSTDLQKQSAGDSIVHIPCGHWHKEGAPALPLVNINLYRITNHVTPAHGNGNIQGIHFDTTTKTLSIIANYKGDDQIGGLAALDGYVYCVKGRNTAARVVMFDKFLNIMTESSVINSDDCTFPGYYEIVNDDNYLYIKDTHNGLGAVKITKVTIPSLSRVGRYTPGRVYTSSDGNLWVFNHYSTYFWGSPTAYPITGSPLYYESFSDPIPNNDHDGSVVSFGSGTVASSTGSQQSIDLYNGIIYYAGCESPTAGLHSNSADSFATLGLQRTGNYSNSIYGSSHGYMYNASGTFDSFEIQRRSLTSMDFINSVTYSNKGRVVDNNCIADIGSYIVVSTVVYTGTSGLFLLNPDLSYVNYFDGISSNAMAVLDNFLFLGFGSSVSVYELVGTELILRDTLSLPGAVYNTTTRFLRLMRVS